ncbi:pur operon repressor [Helcococcus kunzii]|uniref:pur operon repressor n=1 Tax=Helcococcus kunzii TaxID=40091 RepID=UPI0038AD7B4F
MKLKRSERIVDMTATLLDNPNKMFSLKDFTTKYESAKSSISEDLAIIKETFENNNIGIVETIVGSNGGVIYFPKLKPEIQEMYVEELINDLDNPKRILPGGYFYLSDIITNPKYLENIAKVIASQHYGEKIDYVLTVATKGVSVAQAVAKELGIPFVIARKESKITEGSTVSVKYKSQSAPNLVKNMEIGRESLKENSDILLVDDFFRGGGTINGMASIVEIFNSKVVASYVICEFNDKVLTQKLNTKSLVLITGMDPDTGKIDIQKGTIFDK